jgi:hypothetical protein
MYGPSLVPTVTAITFEDSLFGRVAAAALLWHVSRDCGTNTSSGRSREVARDVSA